MVLSDNDIKKFQTIYKKKFGKEISKESAYEQGIKLLILMERIYKPMTIEQMNTTQEYRKNTAYLLENKNFAKDEVIK